jgi:hypothetical protein
MIPVKTLSILSLLFIVMGCTYIIHHYNQERYDVTITIPEQDDNYFYNNIKERATGVNNSVTALYLGQENPADTMSLISGEALTANRDTDYNTDERSINERYKSYLNVAYNTTQHIERKYPDSQIKQDLSNLSKAKEVI